jgi:hypothetical protein
MYYICYLEGCSKFLLVSDRDKMPHRLKQPNDKLYKWHAGYVRDLQSFTGAVTVAYRKGSRNEADPLSRRADVYAQDTLPMSLDGDVLQS